MASCTSNLKSKTKKVSKRLVRKSKAVKTAKKTAARRKPRKGYDSQMGRPTGRDATALARLDELTQEYIVGGMDEVAARQRARAER